MAWKAAIAAGSSTVQALRRISVPIDGAARWTRREAGGTACCLHATSVKRGKRHSKTGVVRSEFRLILKSLFVHQNLARISLNRMGVFGFVRAEHTMKKRRL